MENGNHKDILLLQKVLENMPNKTEPLSNKPQLQDEEEINLRQLLAVIKHRLALIATITIAMTGAAIGWTLIKTPVYEGKFLLLIGKPIDDGKNSIRTEEILDKLGGEEIDYDTQIQVLISPKLLDPVIKKVSTKYPELEYDELIKKRGKSPLKISQLKKTKILEIAYQDEDPEKIKLLLDNLVTAYMRYSAEGRKTELNQGLDLLTDKLPQVHQRVNSLQKQLQQLRQKNEFLLPEEEARRFSLQFEEIQKNYVLTQAALGEATSRYELLQKQLGIDEPRRAIIATYLSESSKYQDLLKQLQSIEVELAKQTATYVENSPIIESLKEKRENLLPLLEKEAQTVVGNNLPGMLDNGSPSSVSESKLRIELTQDLVKAANDQETLRIRLNSLEQSMGTQKAQIKEFANLARQYTELQRELEVNTGSLNRFLEEQQKLELKVAQQVVPWQVITPPSVEEDPVSPRPVRNVALGLIGGLLLGLGAAFLRERLDPVYHTVEELKENTQIPVLAAVPWQKELNTIEKVQMSLPQITVGGVPINLNFSESNTEKKNGYYGFSPFTEAFRSLVANIRLLGSDKLVQTLVLTSVMPQEGKTTCAVNLAKSAAAMGKRVLLIDCDLRRPRIHERLGLSNEQGLSHVLATGLDWYEAIQSLPGQENLSIMTGGEIPPDPIRLLASKRIKEMIVQLQHDAEFDLILWDMPPGGQFADARILATLTDGVIFVGKIGKTDRFALNNLLEEFKLSQIPILGIIANNAPSKKRNSYYYYGYGSKGKKSS